MSEQFLREDRYLVLKRSDIEKYVLSGTHRQRLWDVAHFIRHHRAQDGKPNLECVVVESDWPEYETVWKMIEARVTGQPPQSAECDQAEYDRKIGEEWRANSSLENWFPYSAEELNKLRAFVEQQKGEIEKYKAGYHAARAFIESHAGDPDITNEMVTAYAQYQECKAELGGEE